MKLDVLYQFNEKYAPYAGVSMTSLFDNNRVIDDIRIFILGENLSDDSRKKLEKVAINYQRELIFINTEEIVNIMKNLKMPTYRGSYAANMRLFLPIVLEESVDKLLYLDADTIIVDSLEELCNYDMQDNALAMVMDSVTEKHKKHIGLKIDENYYNSGVILFQLTNWKNKKYTDQIIKHAKEVRVNYPAPDQDLLNVVCKNEITTLNLMYNFQPIHQICKSKDYFKVYSGKGYYDKNQIDEASKNVKIYHAFRFIGQFPWDLNNLHPSNAVFDKYLLISPWKNYNKKNKKLGIIINFERTLFQKIPRLLFLKIFKISHTLFMDRANKLSLSNKIDKML